MKDLAWDSVSSEEKTLENLTARLLKKESLQDHWDSSGNFKPDNALMTFSKFNRNSTASNKQQQHRQSINDKKKNTHCGYCKKKGHWWKECYKRKEKQKGQQPSSSARDDSCAFSAETSAFLAETKAFWIADSGATDHMTFRREWFSTFEEIPEGVHPVCLGDGKKIYAKKRMPRIKNEEDSQASKKYSGAVEATFAELINFIDFYERELCELRSNYLEHDTTKAPAKRPREKSPVAAKETTTQKTTWCSNQRSQGNPEPKLQKKQPEKPHEAETVEMEIEVTPNKMPNHEQNHKNSKPSKKPNETSNNKPNNPTPNPKIRMPPIKISGVKEWSGLRDGLVKCTKQKPEFYTSGRYINVQTHTTSDYRTATKWLEDRHYTFHFKILDDEKCLRVVVRGLDGCITISEIQEDLENKGFEMSKIARLRNSRTKEELPLIQRKSYMGGILDFLKNFTLGSCACCCGKEACGFWCHVCPPCRTSRSTRFMYACYFLLIVCIALILMIPGVHMKHISPYCINDSNLSYPDCKNHVVHLGTYRAFFAISGFFFLFCLLMIDVASSVDPRSWIQNGFWFPKLIILLLFVTGSFHIPANSKFDILLMYLGLMGSSIFIIIQMFFLIEFSYAWVENWMQKYEESGLPIYERGIVFFTLINYGLAILGKIYLFNQYAKGKYCDLHRIIITLNLAFCIMLSIASKILQVQKAQSRSGLLQSSLVSLFLTYLIWTALISTPCPYCVPEDKDLAINSLLGFLITLAILTYAVFRNNLQKNELLEDGSENPNVPSSERKDNEEVAFVVNSNLGREHPRVWDDEEIKVTYNWSFFHLTFAFASLYLMMTFTAWDVPTAKNNNRASPSSFWFKVIATWISTGIYICILILPFVLPSQNYP
ncbi:SERINC3 [Cordylochernes scorpioides]|uniref:SERINC3 n=1 Tax=Cordylochernes scorpioides TaxID=51811 RepID=A0ABY6KN63_9ARAC|nr:SERINC3 [Cordylochernes scorpioides]